MKHYRVTAAVLFTILLFQGCGSTQSEVAEMKTSKPATIRYVALGDSYTICEGAKENERWPNILTKHLKEKGIDIELVANPSKTGWTSQQLIDYELPVYEGMEPAFATLLIGVNDWVRGVDSASFRKNLSYIIDKMQEKLAKKSNLLLVTIPDFGVTPQGALYSNGRDISKGIADFNAIVLSEAKKRNLKCVDIFELTQGMKDHPELISGDGLHPSAKEYALWEEKILPTAYELLK